MDKQFGTEYANLDERKAYIEDNCDQVIEMDYMKPFTAEQLDEFKDELAEVSIKMNDKELELKEIQKQYKDILDPMKQQKSTLLVNIKQRAISVKEECYVIVDTAEKMVGTYNSEGLLLFERPAKAKELQKTVHQILRSTGTEK